LDYVYFAFNDDFDRVVQQVLMMQLLVFSSICHICMQLRNEFSVCRVYISTGTLRSFDRRPLNPPGGLAAAAQQAVHCGYQQQQLQQPLLPLPPAVKTTSHQQQQQMLAAVVDDAAADNNGRRHGAAAAENSHDSSSSGSRGGGGVVDGGEDAAMAIDWDSLIPPVDDLAFSGVDDLTRVIWPHN